MCFKLLFGNICKLNLYIKDIKISYFLFKLILNKNAHQYKPYSLIRGINFNPTLYSIYTITFIFVNTPEELWQLLQTIGREVYTGYVSITNY